MNRRFCKHAIWVLLVALVNMTLVNSNAMSAPITIELHRGNSPQTQAVLTTYLADEPNGISVLICPGGGYGGLAIQPEGHGIARWLNQHGISGFVLQYRMPKGRNTVPLEDAQMALAMIRKQAKQWSINPRKIGVMGFSAGGHLASTVATHSRNRNERPAFSVLVYPVISLGEHTHGGSRRNLLGNEPSDELIAQYSNELRVNRKPPPAFLTHAVDDTVVRKINSEMYRDACREHGVPVEYLELPNGGHGLNGYQGTSWDAWQKASIPWIKGLW
ncbi:MAG: alpha/beta hydrolase [Planctomycetaceae bacterium]|nr:alpha/beta hydrolase [Planctomycetaceae bacterium]